MKPEPYPHSAACSLIAAITGAATLITIDAWVLLAIAAHAWGVER
jgi:hypothetical protein